MKNILLLGSNSASRQRLLREAGIPFEVIGHNADESACSLSGSLQKIVQSIALEKMNHVCLPDMQESAGKDLRGLPEVAARRRRVFLLTADTLCMTNAGEILGKPVDRADAIAKLKSGRGGARCGTAFCLDKRVYKLDEWHLVKRIELFVSSEYIFDVPDNFIDTYLENSWGLKASGAIAIEDFGSQFLKEVHGSYSSIVGLPMYELRQALIDISFF